MKKNVFIESKNIHFSYLKDTFGVFGGGFRIEILKQIYWLKKSRIFYWGEIDDQGFQILSQLRLSKREITNILRKKLPHLRTIFGVKRIGIFGSYSKGFQKEDSDVDLIVEFERPIGLKFFELSEYIENL